MENRCRSGIQNDIKKLAMATPPKSVKPRSSPTVPSAKKSAPSYDEQISDLGLVSAGKVVLGVDLSQPANCDQDGYVVGTSFPYPVYDSIITKVVEQNASPWDPPGGPYAVGIVAPDGRTIYRVVRVSGFGELAEHVQPLVAAGFQDILATLQHPKWDAILVPTAGLLAAEVSTLSVPVLGQADDADRSPSILEDLEAAAEQLADLSPTEREQVALARVGQGRFRADLVRVFVGRCALTGLQFGPVLRASHIKPWRDATNAERLGPENGLLLRADVDALFDAGCIAFGEGGNLLLASTIPESVAHSLAAMGVDEQARLAAEVLTAGRRAFLAYHRERVFLG